ncbi:hypothetical protein [Streptomyces sp. NPDC057909]|uniref:hypothetical protein n=1 Tax=Streptomyces sp. NPDC057909 TaxID=3346277 RepID=UPI0036F07FBB
MRLGPGPPVGRRAVVCGNGPITFTGELLHIALYRAVPAPLRAGFTAYVRSR